MMQICLKCGSEVRRKGKYCSDACKQAAYRNRTEVPTVTSAESVTVKAHEPRASLEDYYACPEHYVQRVHPERLNWGLYMDMAALAKAGLSDNRVPVPGDCDYDGVCVKTDGQWGLVKSA